MPKVFLEPGTFVGRNITAPAVETKRLIPDIRIVRHYGDVPQIFRRFHRGRYRPVIRDNIS